MLRAIQLKDFRSFDDSGRIELSDLNVFIGPNSAGKSCLMTVIELGLLSMSRTEQVSRKPLAVLKIASFGSFDSVLRRRGRSQERSPAEFSVLLEWVQTPTTKAYWSKFLLRRQPFSGAAYVHKVEYGDGDEEQEARLGIIATDTSGEHYRIEKPPSLTGHVDISFADSIPVLRDVTKVSETAPGRYQIKLAQPHFLSSYAKGVREDGQRKTLVVRPHRPVPRSVYVLDDPLMGPDDQAHITDLLRLWADDEAKPAREQIVENLKTMMLAHQIDVRAIKRKRAPQMAEVRVSTSPKHQATTLADVGYGVSQVLPLLTHDAQLSRGNLLVYQPEVHLHPLAQSRLADVFVASVKRDNRVYVETHSEHLVLRLQALIAGGEIDPDRVRVFCVEHDGERSSVTTMAFDERGIPRERWPKGFLDTGLDLARDLAERRQSRSARGKRNA